MPYFSHKESFHTVEKLIKNWDTGEYVHHIKMDKDNGPTGIDYTVIFSQPTKEVPIPAAVANVSVTVVPPPPEAETPAPKIFYTLESQQQQLDAAATRFRLAWLDSIFRRKANIMGMTKLYAVEGQFNVSAQA